MRTSLREAFNSCFKVALHKQRQWPQFTRRGLVVNEIVSGKRNTACREITEMRQCRAQLLTEFVAFRRMKLPGSIPHELQDLFVKFQDRGAMTDADNGRGTRPWRLDNCELLAFLRANDTIT